MDLCSKISDAEKRIRPFILETPLLRSNYLSSLNKGNTYLKLESEQHTGSFKARGALNKILSLSKDDKENGLVTASTGNHALGFSRALSVSGDKGAIYLPTNAVPSKVQALEEYGVELNFHGEGCLDAELHAKRMAKERNMIWVSPYNDIEVMSGQGTIACELSRQLPNVDVVLACIGGGGMIGGIATWIKEKHPHVKIIGCLPENSPEMYLSVQKGEVVSLDKPMETLSDGSAGGLESDSITFDICKELIDDYVLVSEGEIASAIRIVANKHHKIIEGAAGVAVGAFIKLAKQLIGKNVAIVVCGSNIPIEKLTKILAE